ncbi:MAG: alpha/beta fold hydrolase, partial [Pseudomonadota bacterium]
MNAPAPRAWNRDGRDWPNREASVFVRTGGVAWHVQRMGSGPRLLLLHGTGGATHSWRGLLPALADRFDVVAPDLPGHGFSSMGMASLPGMAGAVRDLLATLDVAPEYIVGHSAGAAIALRL